MFINNSTINSNNALDLPNVITGVSSGNPKGNSQLSVNASKAVSDTVFNTVSNAIPGIGGGVVGLVAGDALGSVAGGALGSAGSKIAGGIQTANKVMSTVSNVASIASNVAGILPGASGNYLQSALKSISSTFGGSPTSLASGIGGRLTRLFANNDVKSASTKTTLISDPVKTNLLSAKPPNSSAFKISSLEAGSQTVTMSGSSSQFGTNAGTMVGTNLSTVMNRLNLDSVGSLASGITNAQSSLAIGGLFSNAGSLVKNVVSNGIVDNLIGGTNSIAGGLLVMGAGEVLGNLAGNATNNLIAQKTKSLTNDAQSFMGRASTLGDATGTNIISFFLADPKTSLLDQNGVAVDTNESGVDASTGNALLEIARIIGCSSSTLNYNSANEVSSLYNLVLSTATKNGMSDLIDDLLGCGLSTSDAGQVAVSNAFVSATSGIISLAGTLVDSISNKSALNTDSVKESIITNVNLKAADVGSVDYIMSAIGTTTKEAYAVNGISTDDTPVYNVSRIASAQTSFTDAVFEDRAFTTLIGGTAMSLKPDGTLWV